MSITPSPYLAGAHGLVANAGQRSASAPTLKDFSLPTAKGVVFWPVGTGDSTTLVVVPGRLVMQIDLHHMAKADGEDTSEWPIIDYLVEVLPKNPNGNGQPYLALFVLTHPDMDHIKGFKELLRRVDIGEIWHTPRIFRDHANQEALCDDAKAFRVEAHRRCQAIIANPSNIQSGDRLRVIGHDDILSEDDYRRLPEDCKSIPADIVEEIDGIDVSAHFRAFIHAPFKDDQAASRNNTSLSLNVVLFEGSNYAQFMFFGDREYPTIKRIFELTEFRGNDGYLHWNVMLCSHHCSKRVMYWQDDEDPAPCFKKDIMDFFENYSKDGYIISSSCPDFTDADGDNPPHKKARRHYEQIVAAGHFLCTHEHPNTQSPWPIVFTLNAAGLTCLDRRQRSLGPAGLAVAVRKAQGGSTPPKTQTTFGEPR